VATSEERSRMTRPEVGKRRDVKEAEVQGRILYRIGRKGIESRGNNTSKTKVGLGR